MNIAEVFVVAFLSTGIAFALGIALGSLMEPSR